VRVYIEPVGREGGQRQQHRRVADPQWWQATRMVTLSLSDLHTAAGRERFPGGRKDQAHNRNYRCRGEREQERSQATRHGALPLPASITFGVDRWSRVLCTTRHRRRDR
jgi:hypothetical protein